MAKGILQVRRTPMGRQAIRDGVYRTFDLTAGLGVKRRYDWRTSSRFNDMEALRHDWEAVGQDMYDAIAAFEQRTQRGSVRA